MDRVAIAGYGIDGFAGDADGRSGVEMLQEASLTAFEEADISIDELDAVSYTGQDTYDGSAISDGQKVMPAGGYRKPFMRIQNGGGTALHQAAATIRSGKADVISIVANDFVEADPNVLSWSSHEALYHRPFGQNHEQSFGLLETSLLEERDITREDLARTAAKNYEAAAENEVAHRREGYTTKDVLESEPIVGPLTELMTVPQSFGAAVIIIVSEEVAKEKDNARAWLTGTGLRTGRYKYRDMSERLKQPNLEKAASAAFQEAGVGIDDIDAAEVAAYSPGLELTSYEALGLCDRDEGTSLVEQGVTASDGSFPVNLSGGPLATSPPSTGGIYRLIAGTQVLEGKLGDKDAERVLVADNDMHLGEPGRTDAVLVLEGGAA